MPIPAPTNARTTWTSASPLLLAALRDASVTTEWHVFSGGVCLVNAALWLSGNIHEREGGLFSIINNYSDNWLVYCLLLSCNRK